MSAPGAKPREFAALDGLRAWAVLMVWNVHYFDAWWREGYALGGAPPLLRDAMAVVHTGHVGVDLFFVLSGFIIFHTLHRRPSRFVPFMRRRYARLLPAHLAAALPAILSALAGSTPLLVVAANVALVQQLVHGCKTLNFVTWSLSYELLWYALAAVWFAGRARAPRLFGWPLLGASWIALLLAHALGPPRAYPFEIPNLARFAGFLLGFAVGKLHHEHPALRARLAPQMARLAPLALLAITALRWWWTRTPDAGRADPRFEVLFYGGCDLAFALLLGATLAPGALVDRLFSVRPLRWLGRVSYSFYLVHALYGLPAGAGLAARLGLGRLGIEAAGWALGVAATALLAALSFEYLEKPYFQSHGGPSAPARATGDGIPRPRD